MMKLSKMMFAGALLALAVFVSAAHADSVPFFSIESEADWQDLLGGGGAGGSSVGPVTQVDWDNLPGDTKTIIGPGTFTEGFVPDDLYVYGGGTYVDDPGGGTYELEGPGLVMAWGPDDPLADGDWIGGWQFDYGVDPNISGATISVTLFAPQFGMFGQINSMTFGLQSPSGGPIPFTRSWTWSVGPNPVVDLPWNVSNPITIQVPAQWAGGIGDATALNGNTFAPVAATLFADNGFDPTKAQWFVAFENAQWIGNNVINPPGSGQVQAWNFWRNLTVTAPPPVIVPEPAAVPMLGLGLFGLALRRRRK